MGKTKTLILGLGNSLLSDDGVGLTIAAELKNRLNESDITVMETSVAGLSLLDLLVGYDRAIIIDAIQTLDGKPGQIYRLDPEAFDTTRRTISPHDVNFTTALEFGKKVGLPLPQEIVIFAIEVSDVSTFSEECTPQVTRAIPTCVEMVLQELKRW
ncbi:MAG: hydrogenase maturation protease [Dehalococcoidia bacterium]|nr:hydrogenase maturation protease [Dehalococcoidia bacterium]